MLNNNKMLLKGSWDTRSVDCKFISELDDRRYTGVLTDVHASSTEECILENRFELSANV